MPKRSTSPTRVQLPEGYWLDCREAGSPYWHVYWAKPNRGKCSTGTTNRAAAEDRFFSEILPLRRAELAKVGGAARRDDPLWDELLDWYCEAKRHEGASESTYGGLVPIRRAVTGKRVSETDGAFWMQYQADRRSGLYSKFRWLQKNWVGTCRASEGTLLHELRLMLAVLRRGVKAQKVALALMPQFVMPRNPEPRAACPDAAQMRALLDYALTSSPREEQGPLRRVSLFACLAICTGGRARAIEWLTWDRVDLAEGWIDLQRGDRRVTKKRNATVAILGELRPVLERAWRERENEWVLRSHASVHSQWDAFCQAAVGMKFRRHDMRHGLATKMVNDGVSMGGVADFLGNTEAMVRRVYSHHNRAAVARREVLANWKPL
jgi:site-specific recombinase XerC